VRIMVKLLPTFSKKAALRLAALTGLGLGLSGCVYDYGGDGYYAEGYGADQCDPYSEFDSYYDCDNRLGFVNIGFGGGWYDNYYYPGHGFYLFDSYGSRYSMHDRYRRYWAQQRYHYYQNYSRGGHGRGYGRGRGHGYGNGHGYNQGQGHGGYYGGNRSHGDYGHRRRRDDNGVIGNVVRDVAPRQEQRNNEGGRGRGRWNGQNNDGGASAVQTPQVNYPAARAARSQPVSQPSPQPEARSAPQERPAAQARSGSGLSPMGRSIMGRKNRD
jgi:hypothetical protein